MTRDVAQAKLDAFFEGALPDGEVAALEVELSEFPDLSEEFAVWRKLERLETEVPSPGLSLRLAEMLDDFKMRESTAPVPPKPASWLERTLESFWPSQPAYGLAAAALCLLVGLAIGFQAGRRGEDTILRSLKQEVKDTRELAILTMLQQQNAEERLRGVSYTTGLQDPDDVVLGALIRTLRYDTSVDVRLASLDALARHKDHPAVKRAFIEAVRDPSNPLVQVELVEQLATIADPQARQILEELAVSQTVDVNVRQMAAQSLQQQL